MNQPSRFLRAWVEGAERHLASLVSSSPEALPIRVERMRMVMRAFYAYVLFVAFPWSSRASTGWTIGTVPRPRLNLDVAALVPVEHWNSASVIACFTLVVCSITLCVQPSLRVPKILLAIAFVFVTATHHDLKGKVDHGNHPAMWTAIGLCFLPRRTGSRDADERFVASFLGVQALVATLYTCAGICKLLGAFYDAQTGLQWFHPDALPTLIADNWDRSKTTLLGAFFVSHPTLACLSQFAAFALELGALPAVFFRHLQRPWALALVTMHVMILHSMKIHFHQSCFILILVLVASPYAPPFRETVREILAAFKTRKLRSPQSTASVTTPEGAESPSIQPRERRSSAWRRTYWWGPAAAGIYLVVAFSGFNLAKGNFRREPYPVSAMPMFSRLHASARSEKRLVKLRAQLEREGLFPRRRKQAKRN
jgi:hypothetical protein